MARTILIYFILFMASTALFSYNIEQPQQLLFDETAYIPAAKHFLAGTEMTNHEHPPLAKQIMAVGIYFFGDQPLGWRAMSVLFGALTVVGMAVWGTALFASASMGGWIALVTLCNQFLYVQARVAMLDTFMFCFIAWALAFVTMSFHTRRRAFSLLSCAGVMLGFATACKWFGVVAWALVVFWVLAIRWGRWPEGEGWSHLKLRHGIFALVLLPLLSYFLAFLPLLFLKSSETLHLWDLVTMQRSMWRDQRMILNPHHYMSRWQKWPLLMRPVWYLFQNEGSFARCVLFLGNPFVMWTGLIALVVCTWGAFVNKHRTAFFALSAYVFLYFSWAFIPKVITFHYYYYPAACSLSIALAYVFSLMDQRIKWVYLTFAFGVFVYFFPISSSILIPVHSYNHWMWLPSWR